MRKKAELWLSLFSVYLQVWGDRNRTQNLSKVACTEAKAVTSTDSEPDHCNQHIPTPSKAPGLALQPCTIVQCQLLLTVKYQYPSLVWNITCLKWSNKWQKANNQALSNLHTGLPKWYTGHCIVSPSISWIHTRFRHPKIPPASVASHVSVLLEKTLRQEVRKRERSPEDATELRCET